MMTPFGVCRVFLVLSWLLAPGFVLAGSASSTFRVTATLDPTCTIQTTPVSFGHYNPLIAQAHAPLDVNSTVTITCSKGMATTIALDRGLHGKQARATTRAMKHMSSNEYLEYDLFQDVLRTIVWGTAGENIVVPAIAPDAKPRTFQIFGRIYPAQDVAAGDYADTVVAIVNF